MMKRKAGLIWLCLIIGISLIGLIMMFHYSDAVVFGLIKGDEDSKASVENLFRFSDYPAKLALFSGYEDLEKAFARRQVDFVVYSYTREIDKQLYDPRLSFNFNPDLLEIGLDTFRLTQLSNSAQTISNTFEFDIQFHRKVSDDYLKLLNQFNVSAHQIALASYQEVFEGYIYISETPELFEIPIASHDVHAAMAIKHLFRNITWHDEKKRLVPPGILNGHYLTFAKRNQTFPISIEFILRSRHYDRPLEHPFAKLAQDQPKRFCFRASELVEYEVDNKINSKKAKELRELLFEILKNRQQSTMNSMSKRLHSTIICY